MRGLKPSPGGIAKKLLRVASFTDAWIETETWSRTANLDASHLLQMRGLKQFQVTLISINITSHLLQMRGLKP